MKQVFSWVMASLLLSGCPDSRTPKPPPRVPEPKMQASRLDCPAPDAGPVRPDCTTRRKG